MTLSAKIESAAGPKSNDEEQRDSSTDDSCNSEPSPIKRSLPANAISAEAKVRVDSATEGRCLITNVDQVYAVEYVHLLQRPSQQFGRLESAWGLPNSTLNVDSHLNIFHLRSDLHSLFDKGWWMLFPEKALLERYIGGEMPMFEPSASYMYTLVPSVHMLYYPIQRLRQDSAGGQLGFDNFSFPYPDFPSLHSHIHPAFVICHAAKFLMATLTALKYLDYPESRAKPLLLLVLEVYNKWMNTKSSSDKGEDDDGDSVNTPQRRLDQEDFQRGIQRRERARKRKHCDSIHDGACLDGKALRTLDEGPTTQKRKREFIEDWVSRTSSVDHHQSN